MSAEDTTKLDAVQPDSPGRPDLGQTAAMPPVANIPLAEPVPDPGELAALRNLEERRKQKKRKRAIGIAVAGACAVALLALWGIGNALSGPPVDGMGELDTATVTRGDLSASVQATGTLNPGSHVDVTPEVSGIIQDVMVSEGQHVEAGDVMFTLKNADLEKALEDAQAGVDKAQRALDGAWSDVSRAQDTYDKAVSDYNKAVDKANSAMASAHTAATEAYAKAYNAAVAKIPSTATDAERTKLTTEAESLAQAAYDEAYAAAGVVEPGPFDHSGYVSAIDAAQSSVTTAEDALSDARRAYDYAAAEADKRTVKAPASGTVLALKAVSGAAVGGASGGTSTATGALAQIADLTSLSVDVEVNEMDVPEVADGQTAQVTFTAVPGLELVGKVTSVASVASTSAVEGASAAGGVVTFKVTTVIDQPDDRLKPGMSASVKVVTQDVPDALSVPDTAIAEEGGKSYAFVVTGQEPLAYEKREVRVSSRVDSQAAIESGLAEGDVVIRDTAAVGGAGAAASAGDDGGSDTDIMSANTGATRGA